MLWRQEVSVYINKEFMIGIKSNFGDITKDLVPMNDILIPKCFQDKILAHFFRNPKVRKTNIDALFSPSKLKNEILKVVRACLIIIFPLSNNLPSLDEVFFLKLGNNEFLLLVVNFSIPDKTKTSKHENSAKMSLICHRV